MKRLKTFLSLLLLLAIGVLCFRIILESKQNQKLKADHSEVAHFKYGLFSVNAWKEHMTKIVADEIDKLSLTKENEKVLNRQLQDQLGVFIDKVVSRMKKSFDDSPQGQIKLGLFNTFVDVKEIKQGIPEYASAILAEIKKSKTQSQIKTLLKEKVSTYMEKTFDVTDDSLREQIIKRTKSVNAEEAKRKLKHAIQVNEDVIRRNALIVVVLAMIVFLLEGFNRGPLPQAQYFVLTFTLLFLLIVGVTTPMIDMEAKITEFKFVLFDHPITFDDQVLYFQSKSIQDVFWIMITHKDLEMKMVGILMVCFSIIFPVFKLLSSLAYYYDYCQARKYRIVQFFVLHSGKWSMADVLVVAIFMAYIGFNGIINNQMAELRMTTETLNVMSTNGTILRPGFYLFLSYTILALFLSGFLKKRPFECRKEDL